MIRSSNRIFGLDVFRAVAIIIVVMSHGIIIQPNASVPFGVIDGVELFFVLSGFLIGTILIREIEEGNRFGRKELFNFWKRRWFRTLPNYYLVLLIYFIFAYNHWINADVQYYNWKFLIFSHNLYEPFHGFFLESWSLAVEEWFYILTPLTIIVFRLFLSNKQALLATILVMILAPFLYRWSQAGLKVDKYWFDVTFRKVVVMRLDTIVYGVLAAFVKYYYPKLWKQSKYFAAIFGLVLIYWAIYMPKDADNFFLKKTVYFVMVSIGAMCLLPLADSVKSYRFKIWGACITHISRISYSMYLVNLGLVVMVLKKNFPPSSSSEAWWMYLLFWMLTIGISTLLYYFWEKPMMNLRDRI